MTTNKVGPFSRWIVAALLLAVLPACGVDYGPGGGGGSAGGSAGLTINQTSAPYGVVQNTYSTTLSTTGGTASFTWTVASGSSLPPGLTLNSSTGQVTGTPTSAGSFNVTFQVTDTSGKSGSGVVLFRIQPRTDQVSVNGSGASGNGASTEPAINSTSGQFIAFASVAANLAPTPGGSGAQIFIHDRQTGQPSLVSKDNNVTANAGSGGSSAPSISGDGTVVVFVSTATNLLAPGVPSIPAGQQIYLRNLQTGQTVLVSRDNNAVLNPGLGTSSASAISGNGRFVAYVSGATNLLAPGIPNTPGPQIYVRDTQTNITSLVSSDSLGNPSSGAGLSNTAPAISQDGRFIAFVSTATNLVPGVIGTQVYVRDTQLNQTFLASQSTSSAAGNGTSSSPSIASNGNFVTVAFVSLSSNLVASVSGQHIYIRDTQTNLTTLVSQDNNAIPNPGNGQSFTPVISSDRLSVAFMSQATNLLAPPTPSTPGPQIYLRNLQVGGQTSLVSQDNSGLGTPGSAGSTTTTPAITTNGSFVAFVSTATNLVTPAPTAAPEDIFVRALP